MVENRWEATPDPATSDPRSVEVLAREFARGAPTAVQTVRERVRRILGFRRYGIPSDQLPDLEQEIMSQLWQASNKSTFDAGGGFWGFVEVVSARRCIDWLRAPRRETQIEDHLEYEDARPGPLGSVLDRERSALANRALARLSGPCRELLHAHFVEHLSYRELAERMGKSEGALRVQVYRCVREARSVVERLELESS